MSDTASLKLPLLQPSQAQKHVTVNEALVRLDGLAQLRLQSCSLMSPPSSPTEGVCYAIPTSASGTWSGRRGQIAIASNGGWVYAEPKSGWTGWVVDESATVTYVQGAWQRNILGLGASGAASRMVVDEVTHDVQPGGAQTLPLSVPASAMVFACSARVDADLTGPLTGWELGLPGETSKFGSGMGPLAGSYCTGILSQPTTYYADTDILLTPVGGNFAGGRLIVALHSLRIELPS